MDRVFLLDDKVYNVEVEKDSLGRSFTVMDSEQSGCTMDCTMDRGIIGTFYNYTMEIYPKMDDLVSYSAFYNIIPDPDCVSHEVTLPYEQETLIFQVYISQGKDRLRIRNGGNIWGMNGLSLNFTTMEPRRRW